MNLDDLLESLPEPQKAELVVAPPGKLTVKDQDEAIRSLEAQLYQETIEVVRDANRFREIDVIQVDDEKIPKGWVEEVGLEKARERYRTAVAGAMSAKEAPFALKMAATTAAGLAKARAVSSQGPRQMNATFIQINGDPRVDQTAVRFQYPRREVEE